MVLIYRFSAKPGARAYFFADATLTETLNF
jgi:hypothetical protein